MSYIHLQPTATPSRTAESANTLNLALFALKLSSLQHPFRRRVSELPFLRRENQNSNYFVFMVSRFSQQNRQSAERKGSGRTNELSTKTQLPQTTQLRLRSRIASSRYQLINAPPRRIYCLKMSDWRCWNCC